MTHSNILYILAIWGFIDLFGSAAVLIGEFPRIYYAWRVRRLRPAAPGCGFASRRYLRVLRSVVGRGQGEGGMGRNARSGVAICMAIH